jgi:hypothetical protein
MSPTVKYTLGRGGLFLACALALWPVPMNVLLKLAVAVIFSAAASFFLLRQWREETAQQWATAAERRRAERDQLRSALAGEDTPSDTPSPAPKPPSDPSPPAQPST